MFLVEIWNDTSRPGPPDYRVAKRFESFTYAWDAGLVKLSGTSYAIDKKHGGMVRPAFGTMELFPKVGALDYISVSVYYTNDDDTNMQLIFTGVGFVNNRTTTGIVYDIFTDAPNVQINTDLDYNTGYTLTSVFQEYCTSVGWTLDSSLARTTDIDVAFTASAGQLFADMLSDMCQTYSHYFLIDVMNTTIHLRDISAGVGPVVALDEFEFYPSKYSYSIPASKITLDTETVYGAPYYFGSSITLNSFSSDATLNNSLATRVKDVYLDGRYKFNLNMPMEYVVERGLNFITSNIIQWQDSTIEFENTDPTITMIMQSLSFDSDNDAVLSGYTTMTSS